MFTSHDMFLTQEKLERRCEELANFRFVSMRTIAPMTTMEGQLGVAAIGICGRKSGFRSPSTATALRRTACSISARPAAATTAALNRFCMSTAIRSRAWIRTTTT